MANKKLEIQIISAAKWSTITQIISKLVTPLTNMILARILIPEAFGVIATVTMIISFVEMFTDSGFQKYLVQHEFNNNKERNESANIAFWTNFCLAIFLWIIIIIFNNEIASMVGNPGLGVVIVVASIQLPLSSFSSIQMALYRRSFDFKTLFLVRVIGVMIPFIVTIPLALSGLSYWSLIIGNLGMQLFNAIYLTMKSEWKPKFFYSFKVLKEMLSFSIWSLVEAISIWLTVWVDTFIIGYYLNQYYLGIYKTSTIMVNSLLSLVTASIIPVLFSALSRLQNSEKEFNNMYYKFQSIAAMVVFPLGIGLYLYSDLATKIMLGNQWHEASQVIGVWALTSVFMIVFGNFASEVYRARGKPKLSFIAQILHLIVLIPVIIFAANYGFWPLVYARSLVRFQFVLVHLIIMSFFMNITIRTTFKNVLPSMIAVILMSILVLLLQKISETNIWSLVSIVLAAIFYISLLLVFPKTRKEIVDLVKNIV